MQMTTTQQLPGDFSFNLDLNSGNSIGLGKPHPNNALKF
jgi:hypothetical protein